MGTIDSYQGATRVVWAMTRRRRPGARLRRSRQQPRSWPQLKQQVLCTNLDVDVTNCNHSNSVGVPDATLNEMRSRLGLKYLSVWYGYPGWTLDRFRIDWAHVITRIMARHFLLLNGKRPPKLRLEKLPTEAKPKAKKSKRKNPNTDRELVIIAHITCS